jgi:hypothetical protein
MSSNNVQVKEQTKIGRSKSEVEAFIASGDMLSMSTANVTGKFDPNLLPEKGQFSKTTETTKKKAKHFVSGTSETEVVKVTDKRFAELSNLTDEQLQAMAVSFEARRQEILRRRLQPGRTATLITGQK